MSDGTPQVPPVAAQGTRGENMNVFPSESTDAFLVNHKIYFGSLICLRQLPFRKKNWYILFYDVSQNCWFNAQPLCWVSKHSFFVQLFGFFLVEPAGRVYLCPMLFQIQGSLENFEKIFLVWFFSPLSRFWIFYRARFCSRV